MVLPLSITTEADVGDQNSYHGPFKSSGGAFYTVLWGNGTGGPSGLQLGAYKATDPSSSFAEQDTSNRPTIGLMASLNVCQVGDDLHVVTQATDHDVFYSRVDASSDIWDAIDGASDRDIEIDDAPNGTTDACDIAVLSAAYGVGSAFVKIRVVYQGATDMDMGGEYERIDESNSVDDGENWSGPTTVDDSESTPGVHYEGPRIVLPPANSDQCHVLISMGNQIHQRAIAGDDTPRTHRWLNTNVQNLDYPFTHSIGFDRSGTSKVRFGYRENITLDLVVLEFDAFTDDTDPTDDTSTVSTDNVRVGNDSIQACLAADGSIIRGLFVKVTNADLYEFYDDDADSYTVEGTAQRAGTINHVSCNIYDRSGTKLAMIYDDNGTVYYDEVDLATGFTVAGAQILPNYNQAGVGAHPHLANGAQALDDYLQAGSVTETFIATVDQLLADYLQSSQAYMHPDVAGAQTLTDYLQAGSLVQIFTAAGVQALTDYLQSGAATSISAHTVAGAQALEDYLQAGLVAEKFLGAAAQALLVPVQIGAGVMQPSCMGIQLLLALAQQGTGTEKFLGAGAQLLSMLVLLDEHWPPAGSSFISFGGSTGNQQIAVQFTAKATETANAIRFFLDDLGGVPTDDVIVDICNDDAGDPGTVIDSATLLNADFTGPAEYELGISAALIASTTYWIVFRRSGALGSARWQIKWDVPADDLDASTHWFNGTVWALDSNGDAYFRLSRELAWLAQQASGTVKFQGAGAQSLLVPTQSGVGAMFPEGAGAQLLANFLQAATTLQIFPVDGAQTLEDYLQAAAGLMHPDVTGVLILPDYLQSGNVTHSLEITIAGAQALAELQQAGVAAQIFLPVGAQTLLDYLQTGAVGETFTVAGDLTLAELQQAGVALMLPSSVGEQTLADFIQAATAAQIFAVAGALTLAELQQTAVGLMHPDVTGTLILPNYLQSGNVTHSLAITTTGILTLAELQQAGGIAQIFLPVGAQTLLDYLQACGVVETFTVAGDLTLAELQQAGVALMLPSSVGEQTLANFLQAATATQIFAVAGGLILPDYLQSGDVTHSQTITLAGAQALANYIQSGSVHMVPTAAGAQALTNFLQTALAAEVFTVAGSQLLLDYIQSGIALIVPSATGALTLAQITQAATGQIFFVAASAQALAEFTQAGNVVTFPLGLGAQLIAELLQAASGSEIIIGTSASVLQDIIQSGSAVMAPVGAGASILSDYAQAGAGELIFISTSNQTLLSLTQSGIGGISFEGVSAQTLADYVQSGDGVQVFIGAAAQTLAALAQAGTGVLVFAGPLFVAEFIALLDSPDIGVRSSPGIVLADVIDVIVGTGGNTGI